MTDVKSSGLPPIGIALTYDDVLLVPRHSRVLPNDTNLETQFTRNIRLKTPLVSAAMDTVLFVRSARLVFSGIRIQPEIRLRLVRSPVGRLQLGAARAQRDEEPYAPA